MNGGKELLFLIRAAFLTWLYPRTAPTASCSMMDFTSRNTIAQSAPVLQPPACLRSASHNAILVRYRNRPPKSRRPAPHIAAPRVRPAAASPTPSP